jgi:hypothetical protein
MHDMVPPQAAGLFQADAGVLEPAAVGVFHAAIGIGRPDHLGNGLEQHLVAPPAYLQSGSLFFDPQLHVESLNSIKNSVRQRVAGHLSLWKIIHGPGLHGPNGQFFAAEGG